MPIARTHSYMLIYSALVLSSISVTVIDFIYYSFGTLRASKSIHNELVNSVLAATFRYEYQMSL